MCSTKLIFKAFAVLLVLIIVELFIITLRSSIVERTCVTCSKIVREVDEHIETVVNSIPSEESFIDKPIQPTLNKHTSLVPLNKPPQDGYIRIEDKIFTQNDKKPPYWNMTTSEREKFQQAQVDKFCRQNRVNMKFPSIGRHMLLNNDAKTAFCFAPKVGCTSLKVLFFLSQDLLPSSELFKSRDDVSEEKLEHAIGEHSFIGLPSYKKTFILQTYYKFIMYRNPVERLLSAYRSKVERVPLQGLGHSEPHYNWLKKDIFAYKHPDSYRVWKVAHGKNQIPIRFSDFVDYWIHMRGLQFDEHFQTIFSLCQPCYVRYHYYGNFDTFDSDAEVLTESIGSDSILLRRSYYEDGEQTTYIASEYYSQLSSIQKKLIITKLARDLSFYYTIFPSEKDKHKTIMDCDFELPTFLRI